MPTIQVQLDDSRNEARLAIGDEGGPEVEYGQCATLRRGSKVFYSEIEMPEDYDDDPDADPPEMKVCQVVKSDPVKGWGVVSTEDDFSIISPDGEESPAVPYGEPAAISIDGAIFYAIAESRREVPEVQQVTEAQEVDAVSEWADFVGDEEEEVSPDEEEDEEESEEDGEDDEDEEEE